jgi:hypothetical protein
MALIDRIAACTEAAASPALKAASDTHGSSHAAAQQTTNTTPLRGFLLRPFRPAGRAVIYECRKAIDQELENDAVIGHLKAAAVGCFLQTTVAYLSF